MSPADIARYRLINQQIATSKCMTPGDVVATLGAMQAQDYSGALWAIGLRLPGSTETNITRAISERACIRTWPMRGALHFVAAADVRWMLELLTPRVIASSARRYRELELNTEIFTRSEQIFIRALRGGRQLTREEMYSLLEDAKIPSTGQRGYHILSRLAQEGVLCFGVHSGKQPTFTLLDEWLPKSLSLSRDEALATLSLRYFVSHGPATLRDFSWWSGLKISEARAGLDVVRSQLEPVTTGDETYWMVPELPARTDATAKIQILPGFDEYLLGYTDRSACLAPNDMKKVVPGNNGMFMPTVVKEGRVIGTWKREIKKRAVEISVLPFKEFTPSETHSFRSATRHFGKFLERPVEFESEQ